MIVPDRTTPESEIRTTTIDPCVIKDAFESADFGKEFPQRESLGTIALSLTQLYVHELVWMARKFPKWTFVPGRAAIDKRIIVNAAKRALLGAQRI